MTTKRPSLPSLLRGPALLAILLTALVPVPAHAASAVEIQARALLGGRYEPGGWVAVAVTLDNGGTPTEGWLASETDAGAVRRFVELPAGSRKAVTLYVQPGGFQRQLDVRYEEPNGTVRTTVEVRIFEQLTEQVAIVGDGGGALRGQLGGTMAAEGPEPIPLGASDVPDRPEAMAGLATLVWAGDSSALAESQRRAIERWVADGGQLIVVAGADWQARTGGFGALLPVDGLAAVDQVSQAALAAWAGADTPPVPAATVASGDLRPDARSLVTADDGRHLVSMRPFGAGRVVLIGTDLAVDAFRGWSGAPALWSRLLPTSAIGKAAFGEGVPDRDQQAASMEQALNTLPSLEVPPAELLLAVIVAYILLIGPISYLVLRRLDRRELAWVSAPVLVIVFTATSYGIGLSLKGSDVIVNQIAILRSTTAGSTAMVETYAGVFSPSRSEFDLLVEADALFGRLRGTAVRDGQLGAAPAIAAEQGDPARLRDLPISAGGYEYLRADGIVRHEPMLSVRWAYQDGDIVGTVTNVGDIALDDVAYVSAGGGEMIGDLAPGDSAEFVAEAGNPNATSASDQVYGFGGFDASTAERRQLVARRGVIDALVGYGGRTQIGSDLGGAGDRGPYVIGWRSGEGPMPILLEDADPQRYAEIVEVVTVQPGIGRGEVVVGPGHMNVDVTTEGDATILGPATVSIVSGSATFGISLPLAASDLKATAVTILVGPDPSMVLGDQGGFGGFWPAGYVVDLWDPTAEAWSRLGDLVDASQFPIADPSTAMSDTGRITVRITVEATDPNFGEPAVFVSAAVSGVIGR